MNGVSKNNSVVLLKLSEQKWNTIQYQRKIRRGSINSARKYFQASSKATLFSRGEAGKGTYSLQALMELPESHAFELYVKRIKTNEVLVPKEALNFLFSCANGSVKLARKSSEVRPSNRMWQDVEEGEEHRRDLQGETDEPNSAQPRQEQDFFWT